MAAPPARREGNNVSHATYDPETLLVGVLGRPHGLRGEIALRAHNRESADLARVPELLLERPTGREERRVEVIRESGTDWHPNLVRLSGIATVDEGGESHRALADRFSTEIATGSRA